MRIENSNASRDPRSQDTRRHRVLFGANGWPCGVHELASHVVRSGLAEARIYQLEDDGLGENFIRELDRFCPNIIGFRLEGGQFDRVCGLIRQVHKFSDATIILGGPTATSHPIEVLKESGADFVFAGDAEEPFAEFLRQIQFDGTLPRPEAVAGLAWVPLHPAQQTAQSGTSRQVEPKFNPCWEIDERTLRENRLDWSILYGFDRPMDSLYLTGGRGCPGRCTFCARLHGTTVRTKTASQVIEEIRGADALVRQGRLRLTTWPLYGATDRSDWQTRQVAWCSVFDEDFFLDKKRALEFLQQFEFHGLTQRYRLSFQTNPRSLLDASGRADPELFYWIARLKAMIQLGAESFHADLLRRWQKRHSLEQLETVLDALDKTGQDYNVFQILTDFDSTLTETREAVRLLIKAARKHPAMRIASTAFMIPLFDCQIRRDLEIAGRIQAGHFTDYERPQPDWMNQELVEFAEQIDEVLQDALYPEKREEALVAAQTILSANAVRDPS